MSVEPQTLRRLIAHELERVQNPLLRTHIETLLIEPTLSVRPWDYGEPDQRFPCWIVLDDTTGSDTGIAYSEFGFGPENPWGMLFMGRDPDRPMSMGMDSAWYDSFIRALIESPVPVGLPIWQVFRSNPHWENREAMTDQLSWEAAWTQCKLRRQQEPSSRFDVYTMDGFRD